MEIYIVNGLDNTGFLSNITVDSDYELKFETTLDPAKAKNFSEADAEIISSKLKTKNIFHRVYKEF